MSETEWVQHISDASMKKWKVLDKVGDSWRVSTLGGNPAYYYLPMVEYIRCSPPEEWEDVTEEFSCSGTWPSESFHSNGIEKDENMYWIPADCHQKKDKLRLRKIEGMHNGPAFIVERRKS